MTHLVQKIEKVCWNEESGKGEKEQTAEKDLEQECEKGVGVGI